MKCPRWHAQSYVASSCNTIWNLSALSMSIWIRMKAILSCKAQIIWNKPSFYTKTAACIWMDSRKLLIQWGHGWQPWYLTSLSTSQVSCTNKSLPFWGRNDVHLVTEKGKLWFNRIFNYCLTRMEIEVSHKWFIALHNYMYRKLSRVESVHGIFCKVLCSSVVTLVVNCQIETSFRRAWWIWRCFSCIET